MQHFLDAERRRRRHGRRRFGLTADQHMAVEHDVHGRRDDAFLKQDRARLVPDLAAAARNAEELVDAHHGEERQRAEASDQRGRRKRFPPQFPPAVGRQPPFRERPRSGFEHEPVPDVAMGEHVLDVFGERPALLRRDEIDGRRGNHFIVVVDQLEQRFLDIARARLEQDVSAPDLLLARQVSSAGMIRLRTCPVSTLSRYSDALARARGSPCSSVQRTAAISRHG